MATPDDQPSRKHRLYGWLERVPVLRRFTRAAPGGMKHAGGLVDIFASFVSLDQQVDRAEAEVALDLLRHAFPEADHGWLARRLHRALASPQSPQVVAGTLRGQLDADERISLGLQLYLLVVASNSAFRSTDAFAQVMRSLDAQDVGESILEEMRDTPPLSPLPFEKVVFSPVAGADVLLPPTSVGFAFCAYRAQGLVLIRNSGKEPLWISGSSLHTGQCLRLRQHQSIGLPDWTLTAEDIAFFLNASRTGHRQTIYLNESGSRLTVDRTKSRQSAVRLDFGLNVHAEALTETTIKLPSGEPLVPGTLYDLPLQDKLILKSGAEAHLESLRKQAMETGSRFKMDAGRQECLVSNDPTALKRGDVLLTPGLAGRAVLRINYNAQTGDGRVTVVSADRTVMVNDKAVRNDCQLVEGSLIRLSANQAVRCRFSEGLLNEERAVIRELSVENLNHRFGADKVVLDNVAFRIKRGEMLCIMGPSGSGKSTLLAALAGHLKPTRGHVRLNDISLYDHRSRLAPFIASMPQEEALNPQLSVRQHLAHASTVRKPHLSSREHAKRVDSILAELDLQQLARRRVGSAGEKTLSGGERGRLNLGLDLGSSAEIFLFDEPISGLSSKDSEHVAETLHALSRDNIVIASLHRPGARVLRLFDKVLMLDQGGRVAFFGTPAEMGTYFRHACKELSILPAKRLKSQQAQHAGADFVFDVLETPLHKLAGKENGGARRFPSTFWQERFEGSQLVDEVARGGVPDHSQLTELPTHKKHMAVPIRTQRQRGIEWARLFRTHFQRSLISKFRNRGTIYSILLEAPLLALLIGVTLRASPDGAYSFHSGLHLPVYLFLTATIGMFLGLTNSATEILRDSPVLRRERNCRSGTLLYVAAKFLALAILAIFQCGIYTWLGHSMLDIHGMFFIHWGWMTVTALCGTAMALVVSSLVTTERAALSAVPLLLVPQILLAGALVSFDEMNRGMFQGADEGRAAGAEPFPARLMPLRYAYEGMMVSQATKNPFEKRRRKIQAAIDPLKERNDRRLSGEEDQGLKPHESERLNILTQALTRLMASEATSRIEADALCWKITQAGRSKDLVRLLAIPPYPEDESIITQPSRDFFVNTRTDLLVAKAEIDRVDYRQTHRRSIFLAEWKYWLGLTTQTTHACLWVICGCIALCLTSTTLFLQLRNQRVK
ncbi:MAG: ATP-binding cassette domain-containing protein [Verrucomicrobiae bacterium]|nr:ATP-binding cassette domain-containing protein [Verrucomicrobiae bacterium]NNJ43372.1 ATP-binding cassette domain-containing protein [Akkermansiaceae bacterium]